MRGLQEDASRGWKVFIQIREVTGPFREKVWNVGDLFMAHCEFQGSTGVSEGSAGWG